MSRNFCVKHICSQIRHGPRKLPPKKSKNAKFHKILFWAQAEGPRGSVMKCKNDRREISCGTLVFKVFVQPIWTVKGQKCPFFILKPAALARALAQRPLFLTQRGPVSP